MKNSRIYITNETIIKRIFKELNDFFNYKHVRGWVSTMDFDEDSTLGRLFDKLYGLKNIKNLTGVKRKRKL